jgi:hypothetical protein
MEFHKGSKIHWHRHYCGFVDRLYDHVTGKIGLITCRHCLIDLGVCSCVANSQLVDKNCNYHGDDSWDKPQISANADRLNSLWGYDE